MASTQIPLLEKAWRMEALRNEKVQINTQVYAMGGNANDIFNSFHIAVRDFTYTTVKQRFETHFVGRFNIIFERARFNKRIQREKEYVVEFIESLYGLAETFQFGPLKEELIRGHIGIRKLVQDEKLTLEETLKKGDDEEKILPVQEKKRKRPKPKTPNMSERPPTMKC